MFDSAITWFTPQRRARAAVAFEIALGAWLALAMLLNATWPNGGLQSVLNIAVAVTLGAGVAVQRVHPTLALGALLTAMFLALIAVWLFRDNPQPFAMVSGAIIIFGITAYGPASGRWFAIGLSILGGVAGIAFVMDSRRIFDFAETPLGFVSGSAQWVVFMWPVIALLPWLLGELVRSIRNRRALRNAVDTVSTERDAALTRADLEAERSRVARDVHDIVAHSLTVVIAQADGARYATAHRDPEAADAFDTIARSAREALADVRVLLTELRHTQEAGPQPGLADLDGLIAAVRDSGLTLELREFGTRGRLTEARALALYRITQEGLTNALRHGDGTAVIELEWGDNALDLVVTNPVAAGSASTGAGHGIDGMRERASLAGGELSIHHGEVVRLRARLPLDPGAETEPALDGGPHRRSTETAALTDATATAELDAAGTRA